MLTFFLRTVISISYVIGDYIESSPTELGITEINQVVLHGEFLNSILLKNHF
jgi:hypothetical protein